MSHSLVDGHARRPREVPVVGPRAIWWSVELAVWCVWCSMPLAAAGQAADPDGVLRQIRSLERALRQPADAAPERGRTIRAALAELGSRARALDRTHGTLLGPKVEALRLLAARESSRARTPEETRQLDALPRLALLSHDRCAAARPVTNGRFATVLGTAGQAGRERRDRSLWLSIAGGAAASFVGVDTFGSDLDTQVEIWDGCPEAGGQRLMSADDIGGLQSATGAALPAGGLLLARISAPGDRFGRLVVRIAPGTGALSGQVLKELGGSPITEGLVRVWDVNGLPAGASGLDAAGRYSIAGLAPGDYRVAASADPSFYPELHDELYDNVPCPGGMPDGCSLAGGSQVRVRPDAITSAIDFRLGAGGLLSGRITDEATGAPLPYARVRVFALDRSLVLERDTDEVGRYRISALLGGPYFLVASGAFDFDVVYLDELHRDLPCAGGGFGACDPTTGEPVHLPIGSRRVVDFDLRELGSVRGRVRDAATLEPLGDTTLVIAMADGSSSSGRYAAADGSYRIPLPPGDYKLRTWSFSNHRDEYYDNVPCTNSGCDINAAREIHVGTAIVDGIDFDLEPPGRISGTVVDAVSQAPLAQPGIGISFPGYSPQFFYSGDDLGRFEIELTPDTYLVAAARNPYRTQLFEDIGCPLDVCDPAAGTPVQVEPGASRGIDFALQRLGTISGRVALGGGLALGRLFCEPHVYVYDADLRLVSQSNCFGQDYISAGLEPGSYYVQAEAGGHQSELWDDIPCLESCDPASGTPVPVALGEAVGGIDFTLSRFGRLAGTITESAGGSPLADVDLRVFDDSGELRGFARSDASGDYEVWSLPAGSYYVVADSISHYDELYDDVPCPNAACNLNAGLAVAVALDQTVGGIDFALRRAGAIAGTVRSLSTGEGVPYADVELFDANGLPIRSTDADFDGSYTLVGLAPGVYFAVASDYQYERQLYDGVPCPACDPTTGTGIAVSDGQTTAGIDFSLRRRGFGIFGFVRDALTGRPFSLASVDFWLPDGRLWTSRQTGIDGFYDLGQYFSGDGPFFLSTDNGRGAIYQVHENIECPEGSAFSGACDPLAGTPVASHPSGVRVDFGLRGLSLFVDGFEAGDLSAWSSHQPP